MSEQVYDPPHYTWLKGFSAIDLTEQLNFNIGNVVKYCIRASAPATQQKHDDMSITCLRKAAWYLEREIRRREASRDLSS